MKETITKISFFICITMFLYSCNKKIENNADKNIETVNSSIDDNQIIEEKNEVEKSIDNELITDTNRSFLFDDWHPLIQTKFVQELKETIKSVRNDDFDDNLYNDDFTVEFALTDEHERCFTLYHNIRKVNNYDISDYEIYKYWHLDSVWCFKEDKDISVLWSNNTGAILIMGTDNNKYSTKRGIKVGDTVDAVMAAYANDSMIVEYNYDKQEFETISEHIPPYLYLMKSNECISINCGNMLEEEMMTMSFLLKDGVVNKIIIQTGN